MNFPLFHVALKVAKHQPHTSTHKTPNKTLKDISVPICEKMPRICWPPGPHWVALTALTSPVGDAQHSKGGDKILLTDTVIEVFCSLIMNTEFTVVKY